MSLPEVGERVLVQFCVAWDDDAIIVGSVRYGPLAPAHNPRDTKRWRTPSGNEVAMTTEGWGPEQVHAQKLYDAPGDPKNLGNRANPDPNSRYTNGDGYRYRGRGYVQITGRCHYEERSKMLGVNLVKNPEVAARPEYAKQIMVKGMTHGLFTGHSLSRYVDSSKGLYNFRDARTVVNGHNVADLIAENAQTYLRALDKCE